MKKDDEEDLFLFDVPLRLIKFEYIKYQWNVQQIRCNISREKIIRVLKTVFEKKKYFRLDLLMYKR